MSAGALRSIVNSAPDFIIRYDGEQRITFLNRNLIRRLGLSCADGVIGKRPSEIWPDGRYSALESAAARVATTGQTETIELVQPDVSGEYRFVQVRIAPEREPDGRIVGTVAVGREITEIREDELRLLHFVDNLPGLAFSFRLSPEGKGSFPFISSGVQKYLGVAPRDVADAADPIVDALHPDDRPGAIRAIARSARRKTPVRIEARVVRTALPDRWLTIRAAAPERAQDGSLVWDGVVLDITHTKETEMELRRREEELRVLVDNSPDPILRYDTEGYRIYVNRRVLELTGKRDSELVGGMPTDGRIVDVAEGEMVLRVICQVVKTGEPGACEIKYRSPNGGMSVFQNRFKPEFGKDGRVASVVSVWRDITALKSAETGLRQSRDLLRALAAHHERRHEDERRDLARTIHEDLAQNLSTVRLGLWAVQGSAEGLAMMQQAIDRSMRLMRDMVTTLRPTVLDHGIGSALRWLSDDFRKTVGLGFELDIDDSVCLDDTTTTFLFRAAQEILINVVLHAAARSVGISLVLGNGVCRLAIRDDGRGFDPSILPQRGSFGLLLLSEQAASRGCVLTIDSASGRGTKVEILVPAPQR